jgi:hypothetical protein
MTDMIKHCGDCGQIIVFSPWSLCSICLMKLSPSEMELMPREAIGGEVLHLQTHLKPEKVVLRG